MIRQMSVGLRRRLAMNVFRYGVFAIALVMLGAGDVGIAQVPAVATAPVPQAVLGAKKIFISNAGSDAGMFPHPFSGGPDRAYNQFYAALKGLGAYELVGSPAEADLVLELRLHAPSGPSNPNKTKGASDPLPMFRLVIYDAKTHYVLWALTESIEAANLQKTHDRNFDDALATLVGDWKTTVSGTAAGSASGN
jgi:hypothetical protein